MWPLTPQPLGHKVDKCQHLSGAGALHAMLEAMEHMAGAFASLSMLGSVPSFQSSHEHITRAFRLVEEQEVLLDDQAIFQAVGLFQHYTYLATAYLAFGRQG